MSYIQPNTDIYILKNIPLNKSYEHTVYYENKTAQANAFLNKQKFHLTNYSYQRALLGTIKVELTYEQLIDCNYMMFKNTNFENKWFYCFITGIAYISNEVTAIYYELDIMQTWCYDYSFKPTFVERNHSDTDYLFDNTQPEGLEIGSDYQRTLQVERNYDVSCYTITTASAIPNAPVNAFYSLTLNSVYCGIYVYLCNSTNIASMISAINDAGLGDSVLSFQCSPTENNLDIRHDINISGLSSINGYTPRNKKLFNYPYNFIEATNNLGTSSEYHFERGEYGSNADINKRKQYIQFTEIRVAYPISQVQVIPDTYNGVRYTNNNVYGISYASFPTCGFASDTYKAWWAQNRNTYMANQLAINNNYDTSMAIAQNTFNIAQNQAQTNWANSKIQASSTYNQAVNTAQASSNQAETIKNNAQTSAIGGMVGSGVQILGGIKSSTLSVATGNVVGNAISTQNAVEGVSNFINNVIDYATAQNTYEANQASIQTSLNNSSLQYNATGIIAQNSLDNAVKNATIAEQSSQLSALNTYENATNALVAKKQDMQHMPNTAKGNAICDGMNYASGNAKIVFNICQITKEYAQIVDAYFDKYGYAQRRLYTPVRQNRKHWSYLKTVGCNIVGEMNQNDLMTIKGIYDNGITTWNTLDEVGNYTLDNTI